METRLFVHFATEWAGYSYQWNEAQTEATLVPDEERDVTFNTGAQTVPWHYPSRFNCTKCHTPTAGWTLGPETRQMNRVVGGMNQIDRLKALGAFDTPPPLPYPAAFATPYPSGSSAGGSVEERGDRTSTPTALSVIGPTATSPTWTCVTTFRSKTRTPAPCHRRRAIWMSRVRWKSIRANR